MFARFDLDHSGSLDYVEFVRGVRGEMSDRRRALVRAAFAKLSRDAHAVDAGAIKLAYDARRHPDVLAGKVCPRRRRRGVGWGGGRLRLRGVCSASLLRVIARGGGGGGGGRGWRLRGVSSTCFCGG